MHVPARPAEVDQSHTRDCLAAVPSAADEDIKLLIAPHAAYDYCALVAAHAYAALGEKSARSIRRVVLLGPAHRTALDGLATPKAHAFETPLGLVSVDYACLDRLADLPQVMRNERAHEREHSLEVQLPFLQALLGRFALVPLIVGDAPAEAVAQVLERLWDGEETLIVISSDLSHYLPDRQARSRDHATVQRILRLDAGLSTDEACGAVAINGALLAARGHGLVPRLLDLRNSGDAVGGLERVVGYAALSFAAPCRDGGKRRG